MDYCCSDTSVERPFMVRWVVRSIPHGVHIELFLVLATISRLVLCAYEK